MMVSYRLRKLFCVGIILFGTTGLFAAGDEEIENLCPVCLEVDLAASSPQNPAILLHPVEERHRLAHSVCLQCAHGCLNREDDWGFALPPECPACRVRMPLDVQNQINQRWGVAQRRQADEIRRREAEQAQLLRQQIRQDGAGREAAEERRRHEAEQQQRVREEGNRDRRDYGPWDDSFHNHDGDDAGDGPRGGFIRRNPVFVTTVVVCLAIACHKLWCSYKERIAQKARERGQAFAARAQQQKR